MIRYKKIILILFTIIFLSEPIYSQEIAPIEKYSPEIYSGGNQNWMISQGDDKNIYVANNEGLLEYNGAEWKLYPTPNKSIIRSVKVIDNRIYTGCYMDFGFWKRNSKGKLVYNSISNQFKDQIQNDEQFWKILDYNEWVIFQSLNNIYFYNTKLNTIRKIHYDNTITKVYNVEGEIYYHVVNQGIYKLSEGITTLIIKADLFKNDWIINIFKSAEGLILASQTFGFYTFENQNFKKWEVAADESLKSTKIYSCIQLTDNTFLLGTISKGIIQIDGKGAVINQYNQYNGLSNNTVLSLFEDANKNIWAGLDNGINNLNINSPIHNFNDEKGVLGTVYSSKLLNNILYVGTNQGLFYKNYGSKEPYKLVQGTKGQVWTLSVIDRTLFCGHDSGTFIVENEKAQLITSKQGTWILKKIPNQPNLILQGNYDGLSILNKINNKWSFRNKIKGFNISSRYVEIDSDNQIWINHEYKGVFKLEVDDKFLKLTNSSVEKSVPAGKNSSLIFYMDKLFYAYDKGVFYFNKELNQFKKDTFLSQTIEGKNYTTGKMVIDEKNKLWLFNKNNIFQITPGQISKTPDILKVSIPQSLRNSMTGFEHIGHLFDNSYLIGKVDGYITLDINKITNKKYQIFLNSIVIKNIDKPSFAINLSEKGDFKDKQNSFEFSLSVPKFENYLSIDYQYQLAGFHKSWIHLGDINKVNLDNLPYGNYTFKARALVGNDYTVNQVEYPFKINKPWYLSTVAWIIYLTLLLIIARVVHKAYKRYYNAKNKEILNKNRRELERSFMEKEQQMMQIKNDQLKFEIESKNKELAISTMSIIKKNEALNNIKNELLNSKSDLSNKSVIRLIDKNLNDSDDWNFFEEAFNNADKNFLKKVKKIHPILTPNDLRLCAYLRLNLSSKEIANLLNISTRSVEIKRYRLRKKMDLPHEASLVSYILEI